MANNEPSKLLEQVVAGNPLSLAQSQAFFTQVINSEISEIQLAAMLTALKIKGETPEEIAGAALAIRNFAQQFPKPSYDVCECVGTGGDGHNTINISTTAAIVAASCGLKVTKHGGRSVSSLSGAADLLESFGANLTMPSEVAAQCLEQANFTFLFAPHYHPGFRHAAPVRKQMGVRTIFNILGPMVNPATPEYILLGVYSPQLLTPIAEAVQLTGVKRGWIVHGSGLDEIALHGPTQVIEVGPQSLTPRTISPEDFGLSSYPLEAIKGGSPQENASLVKAILSGKGSPAHNAAIIINCAALLYLNNRFDRLIDAADFVRQHLASGQALLTLEKFVEVSNASL
jgi:anthranilate phosphoribosyltransferase